MKNKDKDDLLSKLEMIRVKIPPSDIPDPLTLASKMQYENEKEKIDLDRLRTELDNIKKAFVLSDWFAKGVFILVLASLAVVFGIIIWQGNLVPEARLSDKVLMTLLSTTTVNIIGLLYLVIKYVFHHRLKI